MIRPFGLRDILDVRRMQREGTRLDLHHYLIQRYSALATALIAPVPWRGTGLASYVWQTEAGVRGFVQMLKRPGRVEADLLYLTPDIGKQPFSQQAWEKLLSFCIQNAGLQALRRLFASLPEDDPGIDALVDQGFTLYSNEDIVVADKLPRRTGQPGDGQVRSRRAGDIWWLRRLDRLYTPRPVQLAEGLSETEESADVPMAWWELSQQQSYVLTDGGEIIGGVQVITGRRGHWLLLHGDPANVDAMTLLVERGLHAIAGSHWPVYSAVRDYQGGLRAILQDHGFEGLTRRSRLVKHMTVAVKVREAASVPSFAVEQSS